MYGLGRELISHMFTSIPASALTPPLYPGAHDVTDTQDGNVRLITFETNDQPQVVYDYYRNTLRQDGWFVPLGGEAAPGALFEWHQGGPDGPTDTAYRITLSPTDIGGGKTLIHLTEEKFDPR